MKKALQFSAYILVLTTSIYLTTMFVEAQAPSLKKIVEQEEKTEEKGKDADKEPKIPLGPADDFDRGVPRSSIKGFMKATEKGDYKTAAKYLDLSNLPKYIAEHQNEELAKNLRIILERSLWIDLDALSAHPEGHKEDGLIPSRDRVGIIEAKGKKFDILLQRVPRKDGELIWKISPATVANIPELYDHFGYGPIGERLANILPPYKFLGLHIWQWVINLGIILFSYVIALIITKLAAIFFYRKNNEIFSKIGKALTGPVCYLLTFVIAKSILEKFQASVEFRALLNAQTIILILLGWVLITFVSIFRDYLEIKLREKGNQASIVFLQPIANVVKILIVVVLMLIWFENIGFKATTVLAGLGVGGIAVALAAQKSIENLIGAITLYISAPVKIGDFCRVGDKLGTVEEIGLRYTKVRTLDRTILNVANAMFVDMKLENYAPRDKIWYNPLIQLSRNTTPDQLRYILVEVRKVLYSHPKVDPEPARVRFKSFGSYSLDLDIFAYIYSTDYSEFLEIAEDINLRIMDIIKEAGTKLAVPTRVVKYERNQHPDEEIVLSAEEKVREWKKNNTLDLPGFPEEKIQELQNTLQYPPEGSSIKE